MSRVLWLCVLLVESALIYLLATGLTFSILGVGVRASRLALVLHAAVGLLVLTPALFTAIAYIRLPRRASRGGLAFLATVIAAAATATVLGTGFWLTGASSRAISWIHLACGIPLAVVLPALLWRVSRSSEARLGPPGELGGGPENGSPAPAHTLADREQPRTASSLRWSAGPNQRSTYLGLQSRHVSFAAAGALIVACVLQPLAAWVVPAGNAQIAGAIPSPWESCGGGGCHPDAFEQWSASAHALAGPTSVTCLDCHTGADTGKPSSRAPTLLSASATPGLGGMADRLLVRAAPDAHAASLRTRETGCRTCHEDATSAPAADDEVMADASDSSCIECHMLSASGAGPTEMDRSHRFPGGLSATNDALRGGDSHIIQRELSRQWMRSSQLLVDIYPPRDPLASRARSFVPNTLFESSEAQPYVTLGEKLELKVAVTNARSGHPFPFRVQGDAGDQRQSWLAVEVLDGQNRLIFESGALGSSGALNRSGTRVYHSGRASLNPARISPGASEVNAFRFRVPFWAKGDLTVLARIRYRLRADCAGEPGCERDGRTSEALDLARASRSFPIRVRPERELPADTLSPPPDLPAPGPRAGT